MATKKTTVKKQRLRDSIRVAVRFPKEEDYCLVHHAAENARLSMNVWMVRALRAAARKEAPDFVHKPWERQQDRNHNNHKT